MAERTPRPYVVVGVDGSEASKDALRWADRQAELTGAELRAIAAWELVPTFPYSVVIAEDLCDSTTETLDQAIDEVLDTGRARQTVREIRHGHPAEVLVEAATGAELLVLGGRGHGTFTGMLRGSVGQYCAQHAPCPLVTIRHPEAGGTGLIRRRHRAAVTLHE
jgi:nucleotide-binding universal stress UspA family protein